MSQRPSDRRVSGGGDDTGSEDSALRAVHSEGNAAPAQPQQQAQPETRQPESDDTLPGHRYVERRASHRQASADYPVESIRRRLARVERQNRWMRLGLLLVLAMAGYALYDELAIERTIVRQTLLESRELKLLDSNGNARMFVRMYSRVPVLQVLDAKGKPRMSLGLRFDDTPFIDLSDGKGRTRATFEMTESDAPALKLMDESGETTFRIN